MSKKTKPEITVFEEIGTRRFGCRLGNEVKLDRSDLKEFDFMQHISDLNYLKNLYRGWVDLIREFREKQRNQFSQRPDLMRTLVEGVDRLIKETILFPNLSSTRNQVLEELTNNNLGPLREDLVNDLDLVSKEISLLKKAVGL